MTTLEYGPLQKPREFRLLNIRPGATTDPLSLELSHSILDETGTPAFVALSYVWGSPNSNMSTAQVLVQTETGTTAASYVSIGQNLAVALQHLRLASATRTVWADAICINQKDLAERSQQVLLMGDIYRLASGVVAFLGPEADDSTVALDLIEKTGRMVEVNFRSGQVLPSDMGHVCEELGWAEIQRPLPFTCQQFEAISHLLGRHGRIWASPEVSLRKQAGHAKCSDPRDRLYGLLSQLPERDRVGIVPDYTKSVSDVYTETTRDQIRRHNRLDIITNCELDERAPAFATPSWVPDFSTPTDAADIHDVTPELFHLGPSFTYIDSTVIHATGVYICRVACVIPFDKQKMYGGSDSDTARYLRTLLLALAENRYVLDASPDRREHFWETCCRTLWLNNFAERWVPPVLHEPRYHKCLSIIKMLVSPGNSLGELHDVPDTSLYLQRCRDACKSRSLFLTEDGHLGAGAESVSIGDEVAALFGYFTPILLRPEIHGTGRHRVVSTCYLDGEMRGESLLGDLPRNLHGVLNGKGSSQLRGAAYMDIDTGVIYQDDPRDESFLTGLQERGFLTEPSLAELKKAGAWDLLSRAGLPVKTFKLI
ncbi:hypothetical protein Daus18300_004877 [Diaporthe australafricana]|uniref:Heterokaryon incompatibility domain-containing protein n=1 Tax=Diaporthe australafricana TaxID=127596 RepID=A0ABR3X627_9PEZI